MNILTAVQRLFSGSLFRGSRKAVLSMTAVTAVLSASAVLAYQTPEEKIAERIAPVGSVCLVGQPCASAAPVVAAASGEPKSGEEIYNGACTTCHSVGVAGAPKFGNADDWAPYIAKGIETLTANAISGIGAMPPMGTCASCSNDDIAKAVVYMTDNVK